MSSLPVVRGADAARAVARACTATRAGLVALMVCGSVSSAVAQNVTTSVSDGGPVAMKEGYTAFVNETSSLHRAWVVLNDARAPLQLQVAGLNVVERNDDYYFLPFGAATAAEPLAAFEIHFALFDPFGQHMKTLSVTTLADVTAAAVVGLAQLGSWRALADREATDLLTVVAFVARTRTPDGTIWSYSEKEIAAELNKARLQVVQGDLEPGRIQ